MASSKYTEAQMRDMEAPSPKSWDELRDFCEPLFATENDEYGKAVYCISLAATAMFNFAASKVGATGFQASCADMDFLRRTRGMKRGFQIVDYDHMLYPQYVDSTGPEYAAIRALFPIVAPKLADAAAELLRDKSSTAHLNVIAHWKRVAAMKQPDAA